MRKFGVRDLEQCARHAILAHARESDDRMMRLAARAHDLGILDRNHGLAIADERVAHACQATAEGRELHVLLLQGPVGEKLGHSVLAPHERRQGMLNRRNVMCPSAQATGRHATETTTQYRTVYTRPRSGGISKIWRASKFLGAMRWRSGDEENRYRFRF